MSGAPLSLTHFCLALSPPPPPRPVFDLPPCTNNDRHCFEVATPDEVFFMYADDEKQKDEWIGAIGRAIVKYSGSYRSSRNDESSSDDSDSEAEQDSGVARPTKR